MKNLSKRNRKSIEEKNFNFDFNLFKNKIIINMTLLNLNYSTSNNFKLEEESVTIIKFSKDIKASILSQQVFFNSDIFLISILSELPVIFKRIISEE